MKESDERLIERYIRYPETLSGEQARQARDLLDASETAREVAAFYREFYKFYDETEHMDSSQAADLSKHFENDYSDQDSGNKDTSRSSS